MSGIIKPSKPAQKSQQAHTPLAPNSKLLGLITITAMRIRTHYVYMQQFSSA